MAFGTANRKNLFLNRKGNSNEWEPERLRKLGDFLSAMGLIPETKNILLKIGEHRVSADIADTPDARTQGLMHRLTLDENCGMLFIFDESATQSFWMKETYLPLSIAYLDGRGKIINIEKMVPLDLTSVRSTGPARYALEMNEGWFERKGIRPGDIIQLPQNVMRSTSEIRMTEGALRSLIRTMLKENFVSHSDEPLIGTHVVNNNPGCKHFQSEGEVLEIKDLPGAAGKVIVYRVKNNGADFSPGDILEKTMDQLTRPA